MTDISVEWLGLALRSPIVVGACPLSDDLDALRACVKAGAGAVVMRSLFEEQLIAEQMAAHRFIDAQVDTDAEARSFFPESQIFGLNAQSYLARLEVLRSELDVPVIASLNGVSPGGWIAHAGELERAGASAIELNLYDVATAAAETGMSLEERQLSVVRSVVQRVSIPVSVKLSPFYSSLPAFVDTLQHSGARGIVLFNRFYQPDIDLDTLTLRRDLLLSSNQELPMRLHALAVLFGMSSLDLAASGGIHHGDDAAKAILCGAKAVQIVSAILQDGPQAVESIRDALVQRLSSMGYQTVSEARGALSLINAPDAHTWERLNYARLLQGWQSSRNRA